MKSLKTCALAAALFLPVLATVQAHADGVYWGTATFNTLLHGNGSGGEFEWTTSQSPIGKGLWGAGPNQFLTFCVEESEHISYGQTAYAFLNNKSLNTNIPLATETAFLYSSFLSSAGRTTLGYVSNNADATSLQEAVWYLQQQTAWGSIDAQAQTWVTQAQTAVTNGWTNVGNRVQILNMWSGLDRFGNGTGALQDMLVMIPLPAPAGLAGLGLLAVVGGTSYRRRWRKLGD